MAMYDAEPIPTRRPVEHEQPPPLAPGDYVRLRGRPGFDVSHGQLEGAYGQVVRVSGSSVLLEMDEPYQAYGRTQRLYYSSPYQLKKVESVGRLGARELFADDEDDES